MKRRCLLLCGLALVGMVGGWPAPTSAQLVGKAVRVLRRGVDHAAATPTDATKPDRAAPPPMVLRWNNGETLAGELVAATVQDLAWRTPLFDDPLLLAWPVLHRLDRAVTNSTPGDAFQFSLRDGSHLYGDLVGITADAVTIRSLRHGELVLRRAEVLDARRLKGERLVYSGPLGESGWAAAPRESSDNSGGPNPLLGNVPAWVTGPGGALILPYPRRAARLKLPLPSRVDVEFCLRTDGGQPEFSLSLEGDANEGLRVETWGDQLVLAAGDQFVSLQTLRDTDQEVSLRVCWDRPAHRCEAYTSEGVLLQAWTIPPNSDEHEPGLRLENKGRSLALESLQVRAWDGQPLPSGLDLEAPRVQLDDGQTVPGVIHEVADGHVTLDAPETGPPARLPLSAVDSVVFAHGSPDRNQDQTTLTYADGTFLRGRVVGVQGSRATLQTGFTNGLLSAELADLRQLFVRVFASDGDRPEPALGTLDKIVADGVTLHGKLVANGDAVPHWLAVGATEPATPAKSFSGEILRTLDPSAPPVEPISLFFTAWGDALPGTLHGLDRADVELGSPVAEIKKLPAGTWNAVQFNLSQGGTIQGFNAPGWRVAAGPKERLPKEDKVLLGDKFSLLQPLAARTGEIRFTYETTDYTSLRLRLFGSESEPNKGLSYVFLRYSNQMNLGAVNGDDRSSPQNTTYLENGPVAVRLVIDDAGLRCYLNNVLADTVSYPASKRNGSAFQLEGLDRGNSEIILSGFSARMEPGQGEIPNVNPDARLQALTVPRFRKEDPPRHALLAANGDILRGEIVGITNTHLGFRVGLETLKVPRERVTAVVALAKPTEAASLKPSEADTVAKLLDRPLEEQGSYWNSSLNNLIQVVQRAAPELKIKLPDNADNTRGRYRFAALTVGETIASICEQFGLSYRVEGDTVVIVSGSGQSGPALPQKVYWLRSDAVAAPGPVQQVLAGKGVAFPPGASLNWQAGPRQLTMVNTPENQEKLARLLADDFGGIQGSPTHWLRLTNGGRLGLTVERFDPDAVVGTHPLYGRCRLPLAEVYSIRNLPPDPAAANRAVSNWQLVYAPEPVLPTSGGEGSPLLGKDAPDCKLALLDGGDFDLGKERGHVVVLDFWATWCGPCIKSLPGLIEAMARYPSEQVKLVGLNQAEAPEQVKRFLSARGWKLTVALDAGQNVARQYGVDGIPHTVIVGPDGKIAWVKTGYSEDGDAEAAEAVKKLLAPASKLKTPTAQTALPARIEAAVPDKSL